jgi:hypothetical protein
MLLSVLPMVLKQLSNVKRIPIFLMQQKKQVLISHTPAVLALVPLVLVR